MEIMQCATGEKPQVRDRYFPGLGHGNRMFHADRPTKHLRDPSSDANGQIFRTTFPSPSRMDESSLHDYSRHLDLTIRMRPHTNSQTNHGTKNPVNYETEDRDRYRDGDRLYDRGWFLGEEAKSVRSEEQLVCLPGFDCNASSSIRACGFNRSVFGCGSNGVSGG